MSVRLDRPARMITLLRIPQGLNPQGPIHVRVVSSDAKNRGRPKAARMERSTVHLPGWRREYRDFPGAAKSLWAVCN